MFNSKQYSWANIHIVAFGRKLTGARAIDYKPIRDKEAVYGQGDQPQGIQYGNKSYEGTLTVLQSEIEALTGLAKANGYQDVTDIDFDAVVAYVPQGGGPIVTETLKYVSIREVPKGMKQGDKFMEVALPFICLGIE